MEGRALRLPCVEPLLHIPISAIVTFATNRTEASVLLRVGELAREFDHLMEYLPQWVEHQQYLKTDCQLAGIARESELANLLPLTYQARVVNRRGVKILQQKITKCLQELQRQMEAVQVFADQNTSFAQELRLCGLEVRADQRRRLAKTESALADRLSRFLRGCDSFYDETPLVLAVPDSPEPTQVKSARSDAIVRETGSLRPDRADSRSMTSAARAQHNLARRECRMPQTGDGSRHRGGPAAPHHSASSGECREFCPTRSGEIRRSSATDHRTSSKRSGCEVGRGGNENWRQTGTGSVHGIQQTHRGGRHDGHSLPPLLTPPIIPGAGVVDNPQAHAGSAPPSASSTSSGSVNLSPALTCPSVRLPTPPALAKKRFTRPDVDTSSMTGFGIKYPARNSSATTGRPPSAPHGGLKQRQAMEKSLEESLEDLDTTALATFKGRTKESGRWNNRGYDYYSGSERRATGVTSPSRRRAGLFPTPPPPNNCRPMSGEEDISGIAERKERSILIGKNNSDVIGVSGDVHHDKPVPVAGGQENSPELGGGYQPVGFNQSHESRQDSPGSSSQTVTPLSVASRTRGCDSAPGSGDTAVQDSPLPGISEEAVKRRRHSEERGATDTKRTRSGESESKSRYGVFLDTPESDEDSQLHRAVNSRGLPDLLHPEMLMSGAIGTPLGKQAGNADGDVHGRHDGVEDPMRYESSGNLEEETVRGTGSQSGADEAGGTETETEACPDRL